MVAWGGVGLSEGFTLSPGSDMRLHTVPIYLRLRSFCSLQRGPSCVTTVRLELSSAPAQPQPPEAVPRLPAFPLAPSGAAGAGPSAAPSGARGSGEADRAAGAGGAEAWRPAAAVVVRGAAVRG